MWELLLLVCILGVVAWVIKSIPMSEPFKTVAFGIIIIILLIVLFRAFVGVGRLDGLLN